MVNKCTRWWGMGTYSSQCGSVHSLHQRTLVDMVTPMFNASLSNSLTLFLPGQLQNNMVD